MYCCWYNILVLSLIRYTGTLEEGGKKKVFKPFKDLKKTCCIKETLPKPSESVRRTFWKTESARQASSSHHKLSVSLTNYSNPSASPGCRHGNPSGLAPWLREGGGGCCYQARRWDKSLFPIEADEGVDDLCKHLNHREALKMCKGWAALWTSV